MSNSIVLSRIAFLSLLCTVAIADAPEARAQAPGGGQGSVPGLVQPQGNPPGYYQGYVQQGQYPTQAAPFPGVPAGTLFTAKLEDSVDSGDAQVGDQVKAKLGAPLLFNGNAVIPAGSTLRGSVTKVTSAGNSNYQSPGSLEIQFRSVQTPDGRTLPIATSVKNLGKESSKGSSAPSSNRGMMMPMAMGPAYSIGTMYAMNSMYSSSGTKSSMAPMMVMMGAMTGMRVLQTGMRTGMGLGNRKGGTRASEAKIAKGTQLQLMLDQPILLAVPPTMQPTASRQQPPQYATAPRTYAQAGYAPQQPVPGLVQ